MQAVGRGRKLLKNTTPDEGAIKLGISYFIPFLSKIHHIFEIKTFAKFPGPNVDGSEILRPTTFWMVLKPVVNNGIKYSSLNW